MITSLNLASLSATARRVGAPSAIPARPPAQSPPEFLETIVQPLLVSLLLLALLVLARLAIERILNSHSAVGLASHGSRPSLTAIVGGTARSPETERWPPNPAGPRSIRQAISLARTVGIIIPSDVSFHALDKLFYPHPGTVAEYGILHTGANAIPGDTLIYWQTFYAQATKKIPVRILKRVLESDRAIVEVIAHETHELDALRKHFHANGDVLLAHEVFGLIDPDHGGTLHLDAERYATALLKTVNLP